VVSDTASDRKAMAVPPLRDDVMKVAQQGVSGHVARRRRSAPGWKWVRPTAFTPWRRDTQLRYLGLAIDRHDDRMHGRDERLQAESFYNGVVFYYLLLKDLTSPPQGAAQ